MTSVNSDINTYSLFFKYNTSVDSTQTVTVEVGDGDHQISLQLLQMITQYTKNPTDSSFQEMVNVAYNGGLSEEEKLLLEAVKNATSSEEAKSPLNSQIYLSETSKDDLFSFMRGVPSEAYLNDLKNAEETNFKSREMEKIRKKMQKISGNEPIDELMADITGTSIKISNFQMSDFERLNNLRINSPAF